MKIEKSRITALAVLDATFLAILVGCSNNRSEGRQERLDTFRQTLSEDIRLVFDSIENTTHCDRVGILLTEDHATYPTLDAKLDSIMHAEMIDSFSDNELIWF
ncbi:MAG: hypothetical protein KAH23_09750, partial [Kiritimatiellae bacterium]|nr:hypothetical protein [Kiritimatiellia bacterium]